MRKGIVAATPLMLLASFALAGDGLPSQSKLNKLGLASLERVDDAAGEHVRGKGFTLIMYGYLSQAGSSAIVDPVTGGLSIDPANFVPFATSSGSGIAEDGVPLTFQPAVAQIVAFMASTIFAQDLTDVDGNVVFTQITTSTTSATVFAGSLAGFP